MLVTDADRAKFAALSNRPTVYHDDDVTAKASTPPALAQETPLPKLVDRVEREAARFSKAQIQRRQLESKDGSLRGCLSNALDLLRFRPEWEGVLGFNKFTLRNVTRGPTPWGKPAGEVWSDADDTRLLEWLERAGVFLNSSKRAGEAVMVVAGENPFHPLLDWFNSLRWDGTPRLENLFPHYAGAPDTPLNRAAGRILLIGSVARIVTPGCQFDTTCLLIGPQGCGKSSFCRTLCPRPEFFTDHVSELGTKDSRLELAGKALIEFSELDQLRGRALSTVKSFLTARTDSYRPPYGRTVVDVPRSCVFIGTSNHQLTLTDESGSRRFLPVHVGKINLSELESVKAQLWAEAFARFKGGSRWYLDTAELVAAAREEENKCYAPGPWDAQIEAWLENPQPRTQSDRPFLSTKGKVLHDEVLRDGVGKEVSHWTLNDYKDSARCLTHLGYKRKQFRVNGRQVWFYCAKEAEQ